MSILDKLMEKKDLEIYCNLRIEHLQNIDICKFPEKQRGFIQERNKGRILELRQILILLKRDQIKEKCKQYWHDQNDAGEAHDG